MKLIKRDHETSDIIIIGGGMVGAAVAFGIAERGARVILLDEGDHAFRAARGNFGLVWYQGKGNGMPRYQKWTLESTHVWPGFAEKLLDRTGIDVSYKKTGGFGFCFSEQEFEDRSGVIEKIGREAFPEPYECKMIKRKAVQDMLTEIKLGDAVVGASYSPHDGHVNPLALLTALHKGFKQAAGIYYPGVPVVGIRYNGDQFIVQTVSRTFSAPKLLISAGNHSGRLAAMVDMKIPVRPQKGQLIITERTEPLLRIPSNHVRQTNEGSFQLGFSQEDKGFDTRVETAVIRDIAGMAIQAFPALADLKIVRTWAALRVMTPDGMPIYEESESFPGAFAIALHSGVTLSAMHATRIAQWIIDGERPKGFEHFSNRRFCV